MFTFGCAYYPDYLSEKSWCRTASGEVKLVAWQDSIKYNLERMRQCKIATIRMGEFSWSTVEPRRGHLDFSIFEFTLDQAQSHEIDVIFCTPTTTPPKWLVDEMPEILPITREGKSIPFGSRRHYDVNNERYKEDSKRITTAYAAALGKHPAVVGWQTDNEFGCHNSVFLFTEAAKKGFQKWLQAKFQDDIDKLNDDWFGGFWSQRYTTFAQIELPFSSWADQNPHLELDFRRFSNEQYKLFQREQVEIIKEQSPGRFITHNLMTLFSDLCPWMAAEDLDKVGFDHYQMDKAPHPTTSFWHFALMRSLRNKPFMVLEQQPVQVNWQSVNQRFDYSWLFLWTMQAAALGAESIFYFSWQRFLGGAEQYHDGIISHDVRVAETWQERAMKSMVKLCEELKERFSLEQMPTPKRDVVCIYDSESLWSHEITAQSSIYSTRREIDFVTRLCNSSGLGLGFSNTIGGALDGPEPPKLLILPGYAFEITEEEKKAMKDFLASGGKILSLPRTAMKKRNNQMSPFPLSFLDDSELLLPDFGALLENEHDTFSDGKQQFEGELWAEKIEIVKNWQTLASFNSGLYKGSPAVLSRELSAGRFIHVATCPPATEWFIAWLLKALEMVPAVSQPSQLQLIPMRHITSNEHSHFLCAINFTSSEINVNLNPNSGFKPKSANWLSATLEQGEQLKLQTLSKGEAIAAPARSFTFIEMQA